MPLNDPAPPQSSKAAVAKNQTLAPPNAGNVWKDNASNSVLKRALSNAASQASNASSKAPRTSNPTTSATPGVSQLRQMNIAGSSTQGPPGNAPTGPRSMQQPQYLNPSMAPYASQAPAGNRAPSRYSTVSNGPRPTRFANGVCELSNWTPAQYKLGDIIALPFHEPNLNPSAKQHDVHLTKTVDGFAYTKRRMAVVLWMYGEDLFCVPLYSFEGKGFTSKPLWLHKEYVCVQNHDDKNFVPQGRYAPVVAIRRPNYDPFHPLSAIHITGGFKVACRANNSYCGRLSEVSHADLVKLWQDLCNDAKKQKF